MTIATATEYTIPTKDTVNRAVKLMKKGDVQIVDIPVPVPPPGHVQVQVKCTGICGSDLHLCHHGEIGIFTATEPIILGHESAGVVTALGEGVTNLEVGDRVAIEAGIPCASCDQCLSGKYNLCPSVVFKSTPPDDGQLAKYITHPARWLYKLPDNISYAEGALLEPLSVAIAAMNRIRPEFGKPLLITGCGPIGLLILTVAKAAGIYPIIMTDIQQSRLDYAKKVGATDTYLVEKGKTELEVVKELRAKFPNGEGANYSIECTGIESSFRTAIMTTRDGGACLLVGVGKNEQTIPVNNFAMREVDILGLFRYRDTYPRAITMISSGLVDIKHFITHTFTFEDALEAIKVSGDPASGAIKVQIEN